MFDNFKKMVYTRIRIFAMMGVENPERNALPAKKAIMKVHFLHKLGWNSGESRP